MDIIEIFEAGSTLALNGGGTGVVEKAIIGANATIQYQLICYAPKRHQMVVSDFEIAPVEGKVTKRSFGFAMVQQEPEKKGDRGDQRTTTYEDDGILFDQLRKEAGETEEHDRQAPEREPQREVRSGRDHR